MKEPTKVLIFATAEGVADYAAGTLSAACEEKGRGKISVALAGGSTPALLYRKLAHFREIPWKRIEIFFGDERARPPDHEESNYRLALENLLSRVSVPREQVHRMEGEGDDLEAAARLYEEKIRELVPPGGDGRPAFDLIWLGVGEDGHTASLFPGTKALEETERLVAPNEVPALSTRRLTFTLPLLNAARRVQFLAVGAKKAPVLRRIVGHGSDEAADAALPAARVDPPCGVLEWVLDREAAMQIQDPGLIA